MNKCTCGGELEFIERGFFNEDYIEIYECRNCSKEYHMVYKFDHVYDLETDKVLEEA